MNNIEHDYLKLLNDIMTNGVEKTDRTGTGTISVFGRQIRHDMSLGFPLLTTKKMAWKSIVTELLWFLRGDTNIKYLVDNGCHVWDGDAYKNYCKSFETQSLVEQYSFDTDPMTQEMFINKIKTDDKFAKKWGELGPIYGSQWRHWGEYELDQIAILINDLKKNPDSRRLMVTAWNPDDLSNMVLPPCHYGFQVYTRELSYNEREQLALQNPTVKELCDVNGPMTPTGWDIHNIPTRAISLMWNQRSVDTPLGLPFNIASYALLLELLAMETNMVADELVGNLGDCHIYLNQIDGVKEQLWRQPLLLGRLVINNEFWYPLAGVFEQDDMRPEDFYIEGYESHPAIKFPLSN